MKLKEIDNEINKLVIEKRLLNESKKRTKSEEELKGIRKRIIMINAEIRKLKLKYENVGEEKNDN